MVNLDLKSYSFSNLACLLFLGGGLEDFFFPPLFGEDSQFDEHIFSKGLNQTTNLVSFFEAAVVVF